jgi:hypothetical protein
MKKLYLIHENRAAIAPLVDALDIQGLPYVEWVINKLDLDLSSVPPQGVYLNCISCSAYKRDNGLAIEMVGTILSWLKSHNRCIVNGRRALQLELRKSELYGAF